MEAYLIVKSVLGAASDETLPVAYIDKALAEAWCVA